MKRSGDALEPPTPPKRKRKGPAVDRLSHADRMAAFPDLCSEWLKKKNKYCKQKRYEESGEPYCRWHVKESTGEYEMVPCPLDGAHSVLKKNLKKHLKKCNVVRVQAAIEQLPCYAENINTDTTVPEPPIVSIRDLKGSEREAFFDVVEKAATECEKLVEPPAEDQFLLHESMTDPPVGRTSKKHWLQQASILGHLDEAKLLQSRYTYIEFGAGNGALSSQVFHALDGEGAYVLVDRMSVRNSADRLTEKRLQVDEKVFHRVGMDITDLNLARVDVLAGNTAPVVAIGKHLCGGGTDVTLRCALNTMPAGSDTLPPTATTTTASTSASAATNEDTDMPDAAPTDTIPLDEQRVKGFAIALCCHNRCSWQSYVHKDHLFSLGFSPEQFYTLTTLASWAICGRRDEEHYVPDDDKEESEQPTSTTTATTTTTSANTPESERGSEGVSDTSERKALIEKKTQLGLKAKFILDVGRVLWLRERGFDARLVAYASPDVTLENKLLVAVRK